MCVKFVADIQCYAICVGMDVGIKLLLGVLICNSLLRLSVIFISFNNLKKGDSKIIYYF